MLRIAAVTLLAARLAAVSADDYEYVTEGSIKCDSDGDGTATSADLLFNYENMDVEACNDACQCSSGCFFFSVNTASNKCRGYAACDSYATSDGAEIILDRNAMAGASSGIVLRQIQSSSPTPRRYPRS